ncbi:hypothetical protein BpHYR1_052204 [Brachionus plicatilis]|uniref:Uncharacterized protein n=1 Tax=Brachionus plicatilis TaxID=10195 RepID=A0A3M7S418_BRAPC|nr:hypothetical protein BpHYR1_052204 [Brachionus plicatilis]
MSILLKTHAYIEILSSIGHQPKTTQKRSPPISQDKQPVDKEKQNESAKKPEGYQFANPHEPYIDTAVQLQQGHVPDTLTAVGTVADQLLQLTKHLVIGRYERNEFPSIIRIDLTFYWPITHNVKDYDYDPTAVGQESKLIMIQDKVQYLQTTTN